MAILSERDRRLLKEVQRNMKHGRVTILATKFDNLLHSLVTVFDLTEILYLITFNKVKKVKCSPSSQI